MTSAKHAFHQVYRLARLYGRNSDLTAYQAADWAVRDLADSQDYAPFLDASDAALWAVHWQHKTAKPGLPLWASERNYWFVGGPSYSDSGYCYPPMAFEPERQKNPRQVAAFARHEADCFNLPDDEALLTCFSEAKAQAELEDCRS